MAKRKRDSRDPRWGFHTKVNVQFVGDGWWLVTSPLVYVTKSGVEIVVPAQFHTDFTSVPRILWRILPPWGNYLPAALVHDYEYYAQTRSRAECDAILGEAMEKCENVSAVTRWSIVRGVRIGGWVAYRKHKQAKKIRDAAANLGTPTRY